MPRVLVLCEHPTLNGGERSLLAVLPRLRDAGRRIDAWAPATGPLAEAFAAAGVHVENFDSAAPLEVRREALAHRLKATPYDLVHANSLAMGRLSGPVVAQLGVPSLAHLRDIIGLNRAAVDDLNRHARLAAVSEAVRAFHAAQGVAAEKIAVLYNGVDLAEFRPAPRTGYLHAELGLPPQARLVGIVGQIILRKGQDVALEAIGRLGSAYDDLHVVVVGVRHSEKPETRAYERRLHELAAAVGPGRVRFLGVRRDMPRLLPELSLLLHTARQEPLGRVLLEAAACGVPIVAAEVGGTREIFPRGETDGARLVPADDAQAAADACRRTLDDAELAQRGNVRGRRRIETAFSVEASAAGLLRLYDEARRSA